MTIFTALILGLLIGWLVEWVIDWLYWRKRSSSADCEEQIAKLKAQLKTRKDPLEVIHGIGPVIEGKLNDAGIFTFEALAALSQPEVEKIVGKEIRNLADEEALIKEAKKLAEMRKD